MLLTRLNLVNFRCFEQLRMTLPEQGALFLGDNAQGKTTLLEAICVLLRMQSPRTSRNAHLIRHGEKSFGVAGTYGGTKRRVTWDMKAPEYMVEGQPRPDQRQYLNDSGLIVWMGNDDMGLVRGAAEQRRKYMDFLGVQWRPSYRAALSRYKRALKARNILLKQARQDVAQIHAYTRLMAEHGRELIQLREELTEALVPYARSSHLHIGGGEGLQVSYKPSLRENLMEAWEAAMPRDLILGQTQSGPHRDDMELRLDGHAAAQFTSEGQQRTIALSLKLAQHQLLVSEMGKTPILLIDDIFGELDPGRREALLDALPKGTQTFMTTTHLTWLRDTPLGIPSYNLSEGKLSPSE